jgi:hypothetical protein
MHREALSGIYGYEDGIVKGFDLESEINDGYDNTIEKLEIYQEFLGENEFIKMLDEIRAEAFKYKVSTKTNESLVVNSKSNGDVHVKSMVVQPQETEVKVDISPILIKIDKIKKNIKN